MQLFLVVSVLIWSRLGCIQGAAYTYSTQTIQVPLDHFSFSNNETFQLRYLQNDTFWKRGGPIFFYTGNEGDIELFAQNTGFMWEIAPKFGAMLIFAEHRYYGKTMPFQEKSYSDINHLGYLTSTQALADFVFLLDHLQTKNCKLSAANKKCPVIAFGGSYGGMLSAWMRLKYPYVIDGAIASSAPIFQFAGLTNCNTYSDKVASVFNTTSPVCTSNVKKSWATIRNVTSSKKGLDWLSAEWKLCQPLNKTEDVAQLIDGISDIFNNVAMINYPYPTNFLAPVPAHPVSAMCEKLNQPNLADENLLTHLHQSISVYTNHTGTLKCLDLSNTAGNVSDQGWSFQACSEIVMPLCVDENNLMFEPQAWDFAKYSEQCFESYGVQPKRDDLSLLEYGGKEADYSNVVFTNGFLDPWSLGGVLYSNWPSVYTILIPQAAHHLDLRASNEKDPATVVGARQFIKNIIHEWLKVLREDRKE